MPITEFEYKSGRFARDLKRLDKETQQAVKDAINDLLKTPVPQVRRMHSLGGYRNPKIYTIDVFPNHSYKISFEIEGTTAILRRVGSHGDIDLLP